ncbi:FAD-binding protein [Weissella confusa]|uniref:FAD-binding protein n=1 Tax=Weissella confusa TaxID=1583 RepID=A0A923NGM9_WEICO|nr:FAD-binding protein [Weissella confusa]
MTPTGEIKTYTNEELSFAYRHSLVQETGDVILAATFKLEPGDGAEIEAKMEDFGLVGLVIFLTKMTDIAVSGTRIKAHAGAAIIDVTQVAREHDLSGIEWAAGIPGSVGGAVYMNAGAWTAFPGLEIQQNVDLSAYTNTRVGGNAEWAFWPHDDEELRDVLLYANDNEMPVTVLGNASNLIITDVHSYQITS